MAGVLLTAIGLNPSRVLKVASTLGSDHAVLLSSSNTEHLVEPLQDAARGAGLDLTFESVDVDPYRVQGVLDRLHEVGSALDPGRGGLDVVLAGGTKPMLAAQAVFAGEVLDASLWSLDEPASVLRGMTGRVLPVTELAANLPPQALVRLHAGLGVRVEDVPSSEPRQQQAVKRLLGLLNGSRRANVHDEAAAFEKGVAVLVRSLLPTTYGVYGSVVVTLRDPNVPTQAARQPGPRGAGTRIRTFEVDGLVVRGTRTWTVEAKYTGDKLQTLRTAAAELALRARHVGGDLGHSLLVFRRDDMAERMAEAIDPFRGGRLHVVARRQLTQAAEWVLDGRPLPGSPAIMDVFA
jgi:hypothetical protein